MRSQNRMGPYEKSFKADQGAFSCIPGGFFMRSHNKLGPYENSFMALHSNQLIFCLLSRSVLMCFKQISVDSSGVHAESPESGREYIALYSVCTQCLVNLSLFRIEYPLD